MGATGRSELSDYERRDTGPRGWERTPGSGQESGEKGALGQSLRGSEDCAVLPYTVGSEVAGLTGEPEHLGLRTQKVWAVLCCGEKEGRKVQKRLRRSG